MDVAATETSSAVQISTPPGRITDGIKDSSRLPMIPDNIAIIIGSTGGAVLLAFIVITVILVRKHRKSRRDPAAVHRREPGGRKISGASYTDQPHRGAVCEVGNAAIAGVERRYIELHPTVQPCPEPRLQLSEMSIPSSTVSPSGHLPSGSLAPSLSTCSAAIQSSGTKGSRPLVALKPRREQPLARQRSHNASFSSPIPRPRPQQANGSLVPRPSIRQVRQGNPLQDSETKPLTSDSLLRELPGDGRDGKRVMKRKSNGDGHDYESDSDDAETDSSEDETQSTNRALGYVDMANVTQVALRAASAVPLHQSTSAPEATTGVSEGMAVRRGASFPSTTEAVRTAKTQPAVVDDDDGDCYEVRDGVAILNSGQCTVGGEGSTDDERDYYNCLDEQGACAGPELHVLDPIPGGNHDDSEMPCSNLQDQHSPLYSNRGSLQSTESSEGGDSNDYYNVAENTRSTYVNVPPISFWATVANASAAATAPTATHAAVYTMGNPSH